MKKKSKICFVSVDIEGDLRHGNDKSFKSIEAVDAMIDIFKKHGVSATLFVSGIVIEKFPELVMAWAKDFEIGSHNYSHETITDLPSDERISQLDKFDEIYGRVVGKRCLGFRAPRHVIDANQLALLAQKGYAYDSSVIPAYLPFKRYIGYKGRAPRSPYRPSAENCLRKGDLDIIELPLTPLLGGLPFSGVWLRYLSPILFRNLLFFGKPDFLSLMMHSWDAMAFEGPRSRNSGKVFLGRLEKIIRHLKNIGYEFTDGRSMAQTYDSKV